MPTSISSPITAPAPEVPAGLPDIETLARLANEFFSAVPAPPGAPAGLSTALPKPAGPTLPDFAAIPRLGASDLMHPALPSLADLLSRNQPTGSTLPVPPVPLPNSAAPSFYFLSSTLAADALPPTAGHPAFDVQTIRRDFPILQERVHGRPLVWFDNAATTQKPAAVIERLSHFYRHENSNIHRAAHELAARATDAYERDRGHQPGRAELGAKEHR